MTVLIREGSVSMTCTRWHLLDVRTSPFLAPLHRRPQPARHRRRGPSGLHAPRARPPRLRTARRLSRGVATAARAFGLSDRGMIAPGKRADIVLLDDLETCAVSDVVAGGRLVDDALFASRGPVAPVGLDTMRAQRVTADDVRIAGTSGETSVIGVVPGKIITEHLRLTLPVRSSRTRGRFRSGRREGCRRRCATASTATSASASSEASASAAEPLPHRSATTATISASSAWTTRYGGRRQPPHRVEGRLRRGVGRHGAGGARAPGRRPDERLVL